MNLFENNPDLINRSLTCVVDDAPISEGPCGVHGCRNVPRFRFVFDDKPDEHLQCCEEHSSAFFVVEPN